MYIDTTSLDIGSATGESAGVYVGDAGQFLIWIAGVTGGGNVTIEISADGGATYQTYQASITADNYFTINDLFDYVRINVVAAKANAKATIRRLKSSAVAD
jgi:hypothetical protein